MSIIFFIIFPSVTLPIIYCLRGPTPVFPEPSNSHVFVCALSMRWLVFRQLFPRSMLAICTLFFDMALTK